MSNPLGQNPNQKPKEETKAALKEAIASIDSPAKADQVVAALEKKAANVKEFDVAQSVPTPNDAAEAAAAVKRASEVPTEKKAEAVITQTAAEIAAAEPEDEQVLADAVTEAVNPEANADTPTLTTERRWLREALLKRLDPASGLDVRIFLAINQLPHTKITNALMYGLTFVMTRGDGWVLGMLLAALTRRGRRERRRARTGLIDVVPALWMATAMVEGPIKHYFRRRRPFINVVRAIVVGRKPGSYSFPSGHSASAFAGAYLLSQHHRKRWPLFYAIAALVGFSRIYLGAHYPGDVVSGGLTGTVLAVIFRRLFASLRDALD